MADNGDREPDRLTLHILPTAGTMVGVCSTVTGLAKIAEIKTGPHQVDVAAAVSGIIFLLSAIASYLSFRGGRLGRLSARLERLADILFPAGLVSITAVSVLFALELI